MTQTMLNPPILFLIFKRPDVTAQVLAAIRQTQPTKLYIAADGARPDKDGEIEKVAQTRELVLKGIDWPCEVKTLLRERNLGRRMAVSSAIDWFFEQEEEGIILEDDCLPDQSFFRFCAELLDYYRHDTRVMAISGDNFQHGQRRGKYSYYFSQIPHCWGWATWRRAWRMYHTAIAHFEEIMAEPSYRKFTHHDLANTMWQSFFTKTYHQEINSWAYLWTFANFVNHGLTILPQQNLVKNIGFNEGATHTTRKPKNLSLESGSVEFPLHHSPYMCLHKEAENFTYVEHFRIRLKSKKRVFHKFLKRFKNILKLQNFFVRFF